MHNLAYVCATLLFFAQLANKPEKPQKNLPSPLADRLLKLYQREASDYEMYCDRERRQKLDFDPKPIYSWTNPAKNALQQGVLFVWTRNGCAEVVGGAWSEPTGPVRNVYHEFNSFSPQAFSPVRVTSGTFTWSPKSGVERLPIADAPTPDQSAKRRLIQLRALAREFTAHTIAPDGQRWELRVLAQPLYRYQSTDDELLDGGVFAFVSSAGTDPEVLMVIEAAKGSDGNRWQCAFGRLSVYNTYVERAGRKVWSSVLGGENTVSHDVAHTFEFYHDKTIEEVPDRNGEGDSQQRPK